MSSFPESTCIRCGGVSQFQTRISLPPQVVYRCASCGYNSWIPLRGGALNAPAGTMPSATVLQQQQQIGPDEAQPASEQGETKPTTGQD